MTDALQPVPPATMTLVTVYPPSGERIVLWAKLWSTGPGAPYPSLRVTDDRDVEHRFFSLPFKVTISVPYGEQRQLL